MLEAKTDKYSDPNFHKNEHISLPIRLDFGKMPSMVLPITQYPVRKKGNNIRASIKLQEGLNH